MRSTWARRASALALAGLAAEPEREREFVTTFLRHWGEALDRKAAGPKRRKAKGADRRQRALPLDPGAAPQGQGSGASDDGRTVP